MNRMIIYAFGTDSRDSITKVADKYVLYGTDATISSAKYVARKMRENACEIESIFVLDSRVGLKQDFLSAAKENSVASWTIFKDLIEREGIRVY